MNLDNRDRLLIFLRYPTPGNVKTRLIPALSAAGAAHLNRRLVEHTLRQVNVIKDRVQIELRCDGAAIARFRDWLGADLDYADQGCGSLGDRIERALAEQFADSAARVAIIGTDCPDLTANHILAAFQSLHEHDLVLGPALDGGYYLIGCAGFHPEVLQNIDWGEATVLRATLAAARAAGLRAALLDTLGDVDRPVDLPLCLRYGLLEQDP